MFFTAPRAHGNEPLRSQLRRFLDDPLHAVELEHREQQGYRKSRLCFYLREQRKAHRISTDPGNDGTPHPVPRNHVTFHAGLRAQHSNQVSCLLAPKGSAGVIPFIGNPPSSRHSATASSKGVMAWYHFGKHMRLQVRTPDFLSSLLALANFMRLSLLKAAHANFFGASCRKSGPRSASFPPEAAAPTSRSPFFPHAVPRARGERTASLPGTTLELRSGSLAREWLPKPHEHWRSAVSQKTIGGRFWRPPILLPFFCAFLLLLCCFLGCLLRWLLCYCFLGCHFSYSPFVESTSNLQEILCS